eukprot:TRINITY_DN1303_c0_g1_i2.p1 TRINITY_DN1303_c0_g1~~TRINITY_DN1303_c0_g1_i2.p1  ORF type:complete len:383 (-),score=83.76 TRINITY_DN1303_c0_g1_i2:69-1217(-)
MNNKEYNTDIVRDGKLEKLILKIEKIERSMTLNNNKLNKELFDIILNKINKQDKNIEHLRLEIRDLSKDFKKQNRENRNILENIEHLRLEIRDLSKDFKKQNRENRNILENIEKQNRNIISMCNNNDNEEDKEEEEDNINDGISKKYFSKKRKREEDVDNSNEEPLLKKHKSQIKEKRSYNDQSDKYDRNDRSRSSSSSSSISNKKNDKIFSYFNSYHCGNKLKLIDRSTIYLENRSYVHAFVTGSYEFRQNTGSYRWKFKISNLKDRLNVTAGITSYIIDFGDKKADYKTFSLSTNGIAFNSDESLNKIDMDRVPRDCSSMLMDFSLNTNTSVLICQVFDKYEENFYFNYKFNGVLFPCHIYVRLSADQNKAEFFDFQKIE